MVQTVDFDPCKRLLTVGSIESDVPFWNVTSPSFLAQVAQRAIDMHRSQSEDVRKVVLLKRAGVTQFVTHPNQFEPCAYFQQQTTFARAGSVCLNRI